MNSCCVLKRPYTADGKWICPSCGEASEPAPREQIVRDYREAATTMSSRSDTVTFDGMMKDLYPAAGTRIKHVMRVVRSAGSGCTRQRRHMRPGTVFGGGYFIGENRIVVFDAYVVVDDRSEVGFWTGALTCIGYVAPSMKFEVLA